MNTRKKAVEREEIGAVINLICHAWNDLLSKLHDEMKAKITTRIFRSLAVGVLIPNSIKWPKNEGLPQGEMSVERTLSSVRIRASVSNPFRRKGRRNTAWPFVCPFVSVFASGSVSGSLLAWRCLNR